MYFECEYIICGAQRRTMMLIDWLTIGSGLDWNGARDFLFIRKSELAAGLWDGTRERSAARRGISGRAFQRADCSAQQPSARGDRPSDFQTEKRKRRHMSSASDSPRASPPYTEHKAGNTEVYSSAFSAVLSCDRPQTRARTTMSTKSRLRQLLIE